jgi:hypothetical protein
MKLQNARKNLALVRILTLAILAAVLIIIAVANSHAASARRAPGAASSREAFLQIYKVFTSPRCQNCHPSGESPLQGDAPPPSAKRQARQEWLWRLRHALRHHTRPPISPASTCLLAIPSGPAFSRTQDGLRRPHPPITCRQLKDPRQTRPLARPAP